MSKKQNAPKNSSLFHKRPTLAEKSSSKPPTSVELDPDPEHGSALELAK